MDRQSYASPMECVECLVSTPRALELGGPSLTTRLERPSEAICTVNASPRLAASDLAHSRLQCDRAHA